MRGRYGGKRVGRTKAEKGEVGVAREAGRCPSGYA